MSVDVREMVAECAARLEGVAIEVAWDTEASAKGGDGCLSVFDGAVQVNDGGVSGQGDVSFGVHGRLLPLEARGAAWVKSTNN